MNCADFEKLIYLYEELDVSEKLRVETHLKNCVKCAVQYASVRLFRKSFSAMGPSIQSEERNPFLVNKIMSRLKSQPRLSLLDHLLEKFDRVAVRYALAVISFVLLITFFRENTGQSSSPAVRVASVNPVKIDASAIRRSASDLFGSDKRLQKFSFLEWARICRAETGTECSDCLTKKLNQN